MFTKREFRGIIERLNSAEKRLFQIAEDDARMTLGIQEVVGRDLREAISKLEYLETLAS